MARVPKLHRRTKNGRKVGNWFVRVDGEEVNLGTQNAQEALRRRALALEGMIDFDDDIDTAAADTIDALEAPPAPPPAPPAPWIDYQSVPPVPPAPAPAPAPSAPPAPAPSAPGGLEAPPLVPDGYAPPPPSESWADAANGAAPGPDTSAGGAAAEAQSGGGLPPGFDPAFLDGALEQLATVLVELQLVAQGWIIKRTAKVEPGAPPPAFPVKTAAVEAWKAQLRLWVPTDMELPPWALAVGLVGMCAPIQIVTGTPIKPPAAAGDSAQPEAQAA